MYARKLYFSAIEKSFTFFNTQYFVDKSKEAIFATLFHLKQCFLK
jgi:hypothetical protein